MTDNGSYVPEPTNRANLEFWDEAADLAAELERRYGQFTDRQLLFLLLATVAQFHDDVIEDEDDE